MVDITDVRTYIVNLRRRIDRRERMRQLLGQLPATFTSDWDGPFDGKELTRDALEQAGHRLFDWQIRSINPWWCRPLKYGEIGCTLSHIACWQDAADRPEPYTLVLEDDTVLCSDFAAQLLTGLHNAQSRRPFDLLYLGRYPLKQDEPAGPGLVMPGYSHCTFGYLLTKHGIRTVLEARLDQAIVPVDEFLPAMYSDHPRADLRQRYPRQLAALACEPPLVRQLPKNQAGSDTEDSAFVNPVINETTQSDRSAAPQSRTAAKPRLAHAAGDQATQRPASSR